MWLYIYFLQSCVRCIFIGGSLVHVNDNLLFVALQISLTLHILLIINHLIYRVPLGFICGYPVGIGGELYGGSMFIPSAATDTLQGKAIDKINTTWGADEHRGWDNYKSIGGPVCKKKYKPFSFQIKKKNKMGGVEIQVLRMYGCACHSNIRKEIIERHGERKGWEPLGQWSLSKAKQAARKETQRVNAELSNSSSSLSAISTASSSSSSGYTSSSSAEEGLCFIEDRKKSYQQPWQQLCNNGACNWKMKNKLDDICEEIEEERLNS